MSNTNNKPVSVLRDGFLKSSIWKNESDKGAFFNTKFAKTYTDKDGNLRDSQNFSESDLLPLSKLAEQTYAETRNLRREYNQANGKTKQSNGKERAQAQDDHQSNFEYDDRDDSRNEGRSGASDNNRDARRENFRNERGGQNRPTQSRGTQSQHQQSNTPDQYDHNPR